MHYFKLLSASALAIVVSGCSSMTPKNPVEADLPHPVYAELKQESSGWQFTRLAGSSSSVGHISVNLATGRPLLDTSSEKCETWLFNPYHSDDTLTPCRQDAFRGAQMTAFTVPGYVLVGPFTLGISWVTGMAPMESRFLWDDYNDALADAYENSGLTSDSLSALSQKYATISDVEKELDKECRDIAGLETEYKKMYEQKYSDQVGEYVKLDDKSGFFEKYRNVDPKDWVSTDVQLPGYKSFQEHCVSYARIDTPAEPERAGRILDDAIETQRQRLSKTRENKNRYERLLMSGGSLNIRCNAAGRENSFVYNSSCDSEAGFNETGFVARPSVDFTITGRDFSDVMPEAYASADANIGIELNGRKILLNNTTDKYVSIDALSLTYNDRVLTVRGVNDQLYELAPGARVQLYLSRFDLDQLPNDFRNLTIGDAKRRTIHFALSAKYQITEIGHSRTLHKPVTYSLASLL